MPRPLTVLAFALSTGALVFGPVARAATPAPAGALPPSKPGSLDAEIDTWEKRDLAKSPKEDMPAALDLQKRVEADPKAKPATRARVLTLVSALNFYNRDYNKAAEQMGQAAALWEANGGPEDKIAEIEHNRAAILRALGRLAEAEVAVKKAIAIRRRIFKEPSAEVASSIYNLGSIYMSAGRYGEAIAPLREALVLQERANPADAPGLVMRITGLAAALNEADEKDEAIALARRAVQVASEKLGDSHPYTAGAYNNLGTNLNEAGRYAESIPVLRETLRLRQKSVGEDSPDTAVSLRNLAFALEAAGMLDESRVLLERALDIFKRKPDLAQPVALSRVYGALALNAVARGDWPTYDTVIAQSIASADKAFPENSYDRAYPHVQHAAILARRGRSAEALPIAEQWVPIIQKTTGPAHRDRIWAEALLARLRAETGNVAGGLALADAATAELTRKMSSFGVGDRQLVREAEMNHKSALELFQFALAAKDDARAFTALQLATISDLAVSQQSTADTSRAESPALTARREVQALARREAELSSRQAKALQSRDPAAGDMGKELASLRIQREAADAALRQTFPDFAARYRPSPVSLADFRARMAKGSALIAVVEGDNQSFAVNVTPSSLTTSAFETSTAERSVKLLRDAVDGTADLTTFPYAEAHGLYRMLVSGKARQAKELLYFGGRTLASLPPGMLTTKPWNGSLDKAPWLVRQASVRVIGNLGLFNQPRIAAARTGDLIVGIGGPDLPVGETRLAGLFRSGSPDTRATSALPALPEAAAELRAIAAALPGARDIVLVGAASAEEKVKAMSLSGELANARVLAFATHGLVAGEMRGLWEPALLLGTSGPESGEDGLLGASEIARMRLGADLVILSACNTSAGDGEGGPVYSGLATAFAEAGAGSLLLSHWRVRDDAAARLSVETVRQTASGKATAEALRLAELSLMKDRSVPGAAHPAIWAPFVVVEN
ncbi:MAG: tetratricopeptide repeat protein [Novosphingobium sp.]